MIYEEREESLLIIIQSRSGLRKIWGNINNNTPTLFLKHSLLFFGAEDFLIEILLWDVETTELITLCVITMAGHTSAFPGFFSGKIGLPVFPGSEGTKEEAQKPSWLEELSRKQANRLVTVIRVNVTIWLGSYSCSKL